MRKVTLLFVWILICFSNSYGTSFNLADVTQVTTLSHEFYDVFEDINGDTSLYPVNIDSKWKIENPGYNEHLKSSYWLKFELTNNTNKAKALMLEFDDPHIEYLALFNGNKQSQGYGLPSFLKAIQHKNHVWHLTFLPNESRTIWVLMKSSEHFGFNPRLKTIKQFIEYSLNEYYILGAYYGMILIMALYNLILFFFTSQENRLYFVLYLISAMMIAFAEDGIGFHTLWGDWPMVNHLIRIIGPIAFILSYVFYCFSFLGKKTHKNLRRIVVYTAAFFSLSYFILSLLHAVPRYWVFFMLIPLVACSAIAGSQWKNGDKSVRFLFLGGLPLIGSFVILQLRIYALVSSEPWQVYFFNISSIIDSLLFSMALGELIREQQKKNLRDKELVITGLEEREELKNKVNRELEEKIEERTLELTEAKVQLEKQAIEISEMNLKLDITNRDLKKRVEEVNRKRIHGERINPEEFKKVYPDKISCLKLLEDIKWSNGFQCRKCKNQKFGTGNTFRSRRCTKCGANESPTANTVFHQMRAPLEDCFYLFALIIESNGDISSTQLSEITGVGQKTCWSFKSKVMEQINNHNGSNTGWKDLIIINGN
jgi:hypothetical protein